MYCKVSCCVLYVLHSPCNLFSPSFKEPTKGGQTIFTRSNILVRPKLGSATFFSYLGPDGRMDDGFTEHSGCPVLEGEKWITTSWMRLGVDSVDNWTLYDPSGVRILN
jgi:hypothetical protein